MSLHQFGFKKDDAHFLQEAFDPTMRRFLASQLSSYRLRGMIGFWGSLAVGFVQLFIAVISVSTSLPAALVWFFIAMMFFGLSLHADAKYKLVKVLDRIEEGKSEKVD